MSRDQRRDLIVGILLASGSIAVVGLLIALFEARAVVS